MPDPTDDWPSRPPREPPWVADRPGGPSMPPARRSRASRADWFAPTAPSDWQEPPEAPEPATPDDWPEQFGGTPSSRRGLLIVGTMVAAVLVVVSGAVAVTRRGDETEPAAAPASPRTDPATTAPAPRSRPPAVAPAGPGGSTADPTVMRAELEVLARYVEQVRGRRFAREVTATALDPDAFREAVRAEFRKGRDSAARQGELLRAAGLVPPGYDVVAGGEQLLGESALGYYEPGTDRLVVRSGGEVTPYLRWILVHELTHALDDQHFTLARPDLEQAEDGRDWVFAALVEGTARWVDSEYRRTLSREDQATFTVEEVRLGVEQQSSLRGIPLVLPRLLTTPYDYGEPFVRALIERGGTMAIDTAYERPPDTAEQIVDVTRYYAGEPAKPVEPPPATGDILDSGTLGPVMTSMILYGRDVNALGALLDPSGDPQALADLMDRIRRGETDFRELFGGGVTGGFGPLPGPKGWGGDRYVVYRQPDGVLCMRADWRSDTPAAHVELTAALRTWAGRDSRVELAQPDPEVIRATRCTGVR